jgi:enoyl-CoA hydratase/carnithine racemase
VGGGDRIRLSIGDDGVAVVTLTHPPLNIYDLQMRDELIEAFAAVSEHPDVRAMVLAADGPHFSAGADLREFGSAGAVMAARANRWARDPWTPLWELPVPSVAALHGHCLGAGLEMSLLCDVRVAATGANLGLPEVKLGMLPSAGGTQSLARTIGASAAAPVVMLAGNLAAAEALRVGIVDVVIDDADAEALRIARSMAAHDRAALVAARRALRAAADLPLEEGLRREGVLAAGLG